ELIGPPLHPSEVNGDVLALNVAQLAKPKPECRNVMRGAGRRTAQQRAYPLDFRRLLRPRYEWRSEDAEGERDVKDNGAVWHGVTSFYAGGEPAVSQPPRRTAVWGYLSRPAERWR